MRKVKSSSRVKHLIVVSDLHCGSLSALCPPGFQLQGGGRYTLNREQVLLWSLWNEAWDVWVPHVTGGEPYAVVLNGDAVDGFPHGSVAEVSPSLVDQENMAVACLAPIVARAEKFFLVRGTEAHSQKSAQSEERIATALRTPKSNGQHSQYDLWLDLQGHMIHLSHHIGVSDSPASEVTALTKEIVKVGQIAARFGYAMPQLLIRSHRHSFAHAVLPVKDGAVGCVTTPAWQLQTPFVFKKNPLAVAQIGLVCVSAENDDLRVHHRLWPVQFREVINL